MNIKKNLAIIIIMSMTLSLLAACGGASTPAGESNSETSDASESKSADPVKVGLIASGFGTQSFNDQVLDGLKKAEEELNIEAISLEVPEVSDVANSLQTMIGQGVELIIVPSAEQRDGMLEVAAGNPQTKFFYLAEALEDVGDNVMCVAYKENEASFLAGALGGLMTKSNTVGAVMGISEALQLRYQYGFMAGAKAVNPDAEVLTAYTNSYADVSKGNEVANVMYSKGADYVGTYAGACNLGVFQAAQDAGEGKYCFGGANGQFDSMPDKILASVIKPVDMAVYGVVKEYLEGSFDTSIPKTFGIKENGVALVFTSNEELLSTVPDDIRAIIENLKERIASGEIVVPETEAEFNVFDYSYTN